MCCSAHLCNGFQCDTDSGYPFIYAFAELNDLIWSWAHSNTFQNWKKCLFPFRHSQSPSIPNGWKIISTFVRRYISISRMGALVCCNAHAKFIYIIAEAFHAAHELRLMWWAAVDAVKMCNKTPHTHPNTKFIPNGDPAVGVLVDHRGKFV